MTVLERLKRVDEILSEDCKWTQGAYKTPRVIRGKIDNCYCLSGAIEEACEDLTYSNWLQVIIKITELFSNQLRENKSRWHDVVAFNDSPSTTFPDVKRLIRQMIEKEERNAT